MSAYFSSDSVSGIINFSALSVIFVVMIIFIITILIRLRRTDNYYHNCIKQLKGEHNSLKKDYEELKAKIDYIEESSDNSKKNDDGGFYGMDGCLSDLSTNMSGKNEENANFSQNENEGPDNSEPVKSLTIKEKYNLYLNNQHDLPEELSGTECSFSEYGNQLEKKPNGIFYALNCGNNKYEVYPSKKIAVDDRMRSKYLNVSFFKVSKGQNNSVEPCILQKSMFGKYDIMSKGVVCFRETPV